MKTEFKNPRQLLPREAYLNEDWFQREKRELFAQAWTYACTEEEIKNPGDFHSLQFLDHPLVVVRGKRGEIFALHNICRHRGCEVLEGRGNTGNAIICPYHRWVYRLDGSLLSITNEPECFEVIAKENLSLNPAAVGIYRGLVFVNPSEAPNESFDSWIANMDDHTWPHSFSDGSLRYIGEMTYEMHCNWKVFYENAIDGYHLGYLHDRTLGKLYPDKNIWRPVGRNVVWYSTEREGEPQSKSILSDKLADEAGAVRIPGHEQAFYPGVVMLFPLTILSPSPWGFYVSLLEPITPEITNLRVHSWAPKGSKERLSEHRSKGLVRLRDLEIHPLDSGNFQIEDMWICEKIQRNLHSPLFKIGPLAEGAGAESPLMHFQESVLDYVPLD